jgi:hypothetical protein
MINKLLDKELIILSDDFGISFSRGCTATAIFLHFWKGSFKEVHVVCKNTAHLLIALSFVISTFEFARLNKT